MATRTQSFVRDQKARNAITRARVDAIVTQVAYAQAHGARAVLDEALRNGGHLTAETQGKLVDARALAAQLEQVLRGLHQVAPAAAK